MDFEQKNEQSINFPIEREHPVLNVTFLEDPSPYIQTERALHEKIVWDFI